VPTVVSVSRRVCRGGGGRGGGGGGGGGGERPGPAATVAGSDSGGFAARLHRNKGERLPVTAADTWPSVATAMSDDRRSVGSPTGAPPPPPSPLPRAGASSAAAAAPRALKKRTSEVEERSADDVTYKIFTATADG